MAFTINELRVSSSGDSDDTSNFVELFGDPGESVEGLTLITISGEFEPGTIDGGFAFGATTADAAGYFLIGNPGSGYSFDPTDLQTEFDFFGSPQTFLLVEGFTGAPGDDLDTDNDGVLDTTPWTSIVDSVSLIDGDDTADVSYSDVVFGPDGDFTPAGIAARPDGSDEYVQLAFGNQSDDTPGSANEVFVTGPFRPIYEIQGAGHVSPLVDTLDLDDLPEDTVVVEGEGVTTSGVVTAIANDGFYMQDPIGDGEIATSDAIFVSTGSAPEVEIGNAVEVQGRVVEVFPGDSDSRNLPLTQIATATVEIIEVAPAVVPTPTLIGTDGRMPPSEVIDDDAFTSFDPVLDGIDFFESIENMLVSLPEAAAIAPTNRFGEVFTVADVNAATGISERGTLNISPDDFNPEKIQIDADFTVSGGFDVPFVDVGAGISGVEGVISYDFGNYQIVPTGPFDVTEGPLLEPETTPIVDDEDSFTVATYNVLNLDPNEEDGDTDIADGRFDAIAAQIVGNLNTPDIIGLQEVQDNSGADDDGTVAADVTLQTLVDAILAAGGPEYAFIDNDLITDGASGGQPGGNIRTAFLYNPERVDALVDGNIAEFDGLQDEGQPFEGARLPIANIFRFTGEANPSFDEDPGLDSATDFVIVNNHFSSKGGSAPILGTEQPFEARQEEVEVNGSLDERQAQAQAVRDIFEARYDLDDLGGVSTLFMGDLNEFEFVSPVSQILTAPEFAEDGSESTRPLLNTTELLPEDERYTFNFQGNSQAIDHILLNAAGEALLKAVDIVNLNSEFAETPQRASDHDPVVVSLFGPEPGTAVFYSDETGEFFDTNVDGEPNFIVSGSAGDDTVIGSDGDDFITGGQDTDTIIYAGGRDAFLPTLNADGTVTVEKPAGVDTLSFMERIDLDGVDFLYDVTGSAAAFVARLYTGYDRLPDEAGLRFWSGVIETGFSPAAVADAFAASAEFGSRYGADASDEEFVDTLFDFVLGQAPTTEERDAILADLADGTAGRGDVYAEVTESAESVSLAAPDIDNGVVVTDMVEPIG